MPAELLEEVDEAARARGESRSAFITTVLRAALQARRDRDITKRLNELFADPVADIDHRRTAEELDQMGTDWTDERW